MSKGWTIVEKVMGALQIIWGIVAISIIVWYSTYIFEMGKEYFGLAWEDFSVLKFLISYNHQLILFLLSIFAGITLILNRRIGWISSVTATLLNGTAMILAFQKLDSSSSENNISAYFWGSIISLAFYIMFGILLTKHFRIKYKPTPASWLIVAVVTIILLVNNFLTSFKSEEQKIADNWEGRDSVITNNITVPEDMKQAVWGEQGLPDFYYVFYPDSVIFVNIENNRRMKVSPTTPVVMSKEASDRMYAEEMSEDKNYSDKEVAWREKIKTELILLAAHASIHYVEANEEYEKEE